MKPQSKEPPVDELSYVIQKLELKLTKSSGKASQSQLQMGLTPQNKKLNKYCKNIL